MREGRRSFEWPGCRCSLDCLDAVGWGAGSVWPEFRDAQQQLWLSFKAIPWAEDPAPEPAAGWSGQC